MQKKTIVLAVDDQDINLRLLTLILKDEDFELLLTDDGEGAIEMLKARPDTGIILLDRMLYGEDGMETVGRLKGMPEFKHIPIIMITASWSPETEAGAREAGVFAYLAKPYDKAEIISAVKAALKTDTLQIRRKSMTLNSAEAREKRLLELLGDGFIAHRGGNTRSDCFTGRLMPENSLAAFEQTAAAAKTKRQNMVVETDVMRCKDGFAIVHGDTGENGKQDCWLGKITGEQGYVQDYTLSELQSVRMGIRAYGEEKLDLKHALDKTTILSLESCLRHVLLELQLGLQLEIKSVENQWNDGKDIAALIDRLIPQDHAAREKICILCCDREVLAGFRSVASDVPLGWLIKSVDESYKKGNVFTDDWEKFVSHPVKLPGEYDYIHFCEADGLSPAIARALPVPFVVGGCNNPEVARRMLAQGALAVGADDMAVPDSIKKI